MITDRDVWYDELVEWRDETGKLLVVVNEEVRT